MIASPTVYVVDDDAVARQYLVQILAKAGLRTKVYDCGEAFLDDCSPSDYGCAVVDMMMPGLNGLEVHQQMISNGVMLPVIILTAHGDIPSAVHTLETGAAGYLEKPCDPEDILHRIKVIFADEEQRQHQEAQWSHFLECFNHLGNRERQVLGLMVDGLSSKQIATVCGTSVRTVETQRRHIMKKMDVDSLAQLVSHVIKYQCDKAYKSHTFIEQHLHLRDAMDWGLLCKDEHAPLTIKSIVSQSDSAQHSFAGSYQASR